MCLNRELEILTNYKKTVFHGIRKLINRVKLQLRLSCIICLLLSITDNAHNVVWTPPRHVVSKSDRYVSLINRNCYVLNVEMFNIEPIRIGTLKFLPSD